MRLPAAPVHHQLHQSASPQTLCTLVCVRTCVVLTVSRIGGAVTGGRTHGQTVLAYSPQAGVHTLAKCVDSVAQSLHYTERVA